MQSNETKTESHNSPLKNAIIRRSAMFRSGKNAHRFYYFLNGKLRSFITDEKDFLANMAYLFGNLNASFASRGTSFLKVALSSGMAAFMLLSPLAQALPTNYQSVAGNVQFAQSGKTLNINSSSQRSIANYKNFNIAADEIVNIMLPGRNAAMLNRVLGGDPTAIFGQLNSNGQVFLVNPSGILFGQSAQVNVGSLFASTLNIADSDFMNGKLTFAKNGSAASVRNDGTIQAGPGGFVAFAGSAVQNTGTITAPGGQIQMAVGDKVSLNVSDDVLVDVTVDEALKEKVDGVTSAIANSGTLDAAGGTIKLQADLANALYDHSVNNTGIVQALGMDDKTGSVEFIGRSVSGDSIVANTGIVDVSGTEGSPNGGNIYFAGDLVSQGGVAMAEGAEGGTGGHIELTSTGGTNLESGSYTSAKGAGENSDAGSIRVWSDKDTNFNGGAELNVDGGSQSGNAGFIELSGAESVNYAGSASGTAVNGEGGTLLIDPKNIIIAEQSSNANHPTTAVGDPNESFSDDSNATLTFDPRYQHTFTHAGNTTTVDGAFKGFSNIHLQATQDITLSDNLDTSLATNNDLTHAVNITLEANRNININAALTTHNAQITLLADADKNNDGTLAISNTGTVSSNGGAITLQGAQISFASGAAKVNAGTGNVTIQASQDSKNMTIGGSTAAADSSSVVDISSAELGKISAGTVNFGANGKTGNETVTGNLNVSGSGAGNYNLNFQTGGNFTNSGHTITLGSKSLTVNVDGTSNTGTVTGSSGSAASFTSKGTATVSGTVAADTVLIQTTNNSSDVQVNGDINASTTATINADGSITGAKKVSGPTVNLSSTHGSIGASASPLHTAAGNLSVSANSGSVYLLEDNAVALNASSASADFNLKAGGALAVNGAISGNNVDLSTTGGSDISVNADVTAANDLNLSTTGSGDITGGLFTGNNVSLSSDSGDFNVQTHANNLALDTQGDITVNQTGGVNLTAVDTNGDLSVAVTGGSLDAQGDINADNIGLSASNDVNTQGDTTATNNITITADHSVTNAGNIDAGNNADLTAGSGLTNTGSVSATNDVNLVSTTDSINNSGPITAGNDANLTAGLNINNSGHLEAGADANLTAGGSISNSGLSIIAVHDVNLDAGNSINNTGLVQAGHDSNWTASIDINNSGSVDAGYNANFSAAGSTYNEGSIQADNDANLNASQYIYNYNQISAGNDVNLDAGYVIYNDGSIQADKDINLNSGIITYNINQLDAGNDVNLNSGIVTYNDGSIQADNDANLNAGYITENEGSIQADQDINLDSGEITANLGSVDAGNNANLSAVSTVYNTNSASINAGVDVNLTSSSADINNTGLITAGNDANLTAATDISNTGHIAVDNNATLTAGGNIHNAGLSIITGGDADLTAAGDINNTGLIDAGHDASLSAGNNISNSGSVDTVNDASFDAGNDISNSGSIDAGNNASISGGHDINNAGSIIAGSDASLSSGNNISNEGSMNAGYNANLGASNDINNTGSITAANDASFGAGHDIYNTLGSINAGNNANLGASNDINNSGGIDAGSNANFGNGHDLDNSGSINAGNNATMSADNDINNSGSINAGNNASLGASNDINNSGSIDAGNNIDMSANNNILNALGSIEAGNNATLNAGHDINSTGSIDADNNVKLKAAHDVDNSGSIDAGNNVTVEATTGDITNSGPVTADNNISFTAGNDIDNSGHVAAGHHATLHAGGHIFNSGFSIVAGDDATLFAGGSIQNIGLITAGNDVIFDAGDAIDTSGTVHANNNVDFTAVNQIAASGPVSADNILGFNSDTGFIQIDSLVTGTNEAHLQADGNIFGTGKLVGNLMTLNTDNGTVGGTPTDILHIDAGTLNATANNGSVYLAEDNDINVDTSSAANDFQLNAGGNMDVIGPVTGTDTLLHTTGGHDITMGADVTGSHHVILDAEGTGNISGATVIGYTADLLSDSGNINVHTNTDQLSANTHGNVNIQDVGGVSLNNSTGNEFNLRAGGIRVNGTLTGNDIMLKTSNNGDILLQNDVTGHHSVQLLANGSGSIDSNPGIVRTPNLFFRSGTGDITLTTNVDTLAGVTHGGNITVDEIDGLNIGPTKLSGNNIHILTHNGDLTLSGEVRGNTVSLTTLNGDILDGNGDANNISANRGILTSSGIIGTESDPIDVDIKNGNLGVSATGEQDGVSVAINGNVNPSETLLLTNFPPGAVLFNGQLVFDLQTFLSENGIGVIHSSLGKDGKPSSDLLTADSLKNVQADITNLEDYVPQAFNLLMLDIFGTQNSDQNDDQKKKNKPGTPAPSDTPEQGTTPPGQ